MVGRATTHAQRVALVERKQDGESLRQIAIGLHLNFYTVRKWWWVYCQQGWAGLAPRPPGVVARGALSRYDPLVKYVALRLKRQHPGWGLDKLRLELRRRPCLAGKTLPGRTALYTYLHTFYPRLSAHRPLRIRCPAASSGRVDHVHACWQMDFKGVVAIAGVGEVKPFLVCDEFTSAPLAGIVHATQPALTTRQVQANLRTVFTHWGLARGDPHGSGSAVGRQPPSGVAGSPAAVAGGVRHPTAHQPPRSPHRQRSD